MTYNLLLITYYFQLLAFCFQLSAFPFPLSTYRSIQMRISPIHMDQLSGGMR